MLNKIRQVLAKWTEPTEVGTIGSGIEKPTAVLANLIAAEILMGNFKMTDKRVDNSAKPADYFEIMCQINWNTVIKSEKFLIEIKSNGRINSDYEILPDGVIDGAFRLNVITPVVSFQANDLEVIKLALKKRRWQEIQQQKAAREFASEQRALDAIEKWMKIEPEKEGEAK